MLFRKDRCRNEHRRLLPVERHSEGGPHRDFCLPRPRIAKDQPVHRILSGQIVINVFDRACLELRLHIRERRGEFGFQLEVSENGWLRGGFANRVELDELLYLFFDILSHFVPGPDPPVAFQPCQSDECLIPDILMHPIQIFYGHEDIHLIRVFDLQILAGPSVIADHLVPLITTDPEVFVND